MGRLTKQHDVGGLLRELAVDDVLHTQVDDAVA